MNEKELYRAVLAELELDISSANFKSFLSPTKLLKSEGNILEISCPTNFCKERLEERYYGQIKRVVDKITRKKNELVFVVRSETQDRKGRKAEELGPLFEKEPKDTRHQTSPGGLSLRYTFQNFVVGSSNNLAHAVAQGVVKKPGKLHNPYFLYSAVGLGKTHLIQAIGNKILKTHPRLKVLYCTSEDFTNELIWAMQRKKTGAFKDKFRKVDVLLIDDVQFIAGKDTIQEEFFHTFNALHQAQKQIVVTSDKPPKEIAKLEERLSSRFGSGMIADIQPPDYGTRVAILRSKREEFNLPAPDEVLDLIAETIPSNIRDLEGALRQVVTTASAQNKKVTVDFAKEVLGKNRISPRKRTTPGKILDTVCTYYSLKRRDLSGRARPQSIALPRQVAMYLLRDLTEISLMRVGEILGGRDHTTVIHGARKIERQLKNDPKLKQDILNIKQTLRG